MRYLAAYLLLQLSGQHAPSAESVEKVISSVGIEVDSERLNKLVEELHGKNIEELIAEGQSKLASVPSGGAAAGAGAAAGGAEAAAEEKAEEEEEESDDDMGFGLFD